MMVGRGSRRPLLERAVGKPMFDRGQRLGACAISPSNRAEGSAMEQFSLLPFVLAATAGSA